MGIGQVIGFVTAFGMFFLMGDQSDWERIYSCKTDRTAFWGYLIPLTITLLLLLMPTYIGGISEKYCGWSSGIIFIVLVYVEDASGMDLHHYYYNDSVCHAVVGGIRLW